MQTQFVFNRIERKYLLSEPVYLQLREDLREHMQEDAYGLTTICNIYFDTEDALLIRRSLEHPVYKEKLRLRSYGVPGPDSTVFLEIKKKYERVVNKRRISIGLEQAYALTGSGCGMAFMEGRTAQERQILQELEFFMKRYPLSRQLYLAYDRIALFGREDPEFRVTFDTRIRSRREDVALEEGDRGTLLMPEDIRLMETKINGAVPLWFSKLLARYRICPTSFSKYGNIYRQERGCWRFRRETAC